MHSRLLEGNLIALYSNEYEKNQFLSTENIKYHVLSMIIYEMIILIMKKCLIIYLIILYRLVCEFSVKNKIRLTMSNYTNKINNEIKWFIQICEKIITKI